MWVKTADRDIEKLTSPFKEKVKDFLNDERIKDKIFITEAYRSQERQNYLYYDVKPRVTWTLNSNHTKGIAIDIAFSWSDLYPSDIYEWKEVAEVAKEYGIDWGYDLWKTDKPHFQDNWEKYVKNKYMELMKDEVSEDNLVFYSHEWEEPLTEWEIKCLLEIWLERKVKQLKKDIINFLQK